MVSLQQWCPSEQWCPSAVNIILLPYLEHVDYIVVGTVIQEVKTSNIAREVRM